MKIVMKVIGKMAVIFVAVCSLIIAADAGNGSRSEKISKKQVLIS